MQTATEVAPQDTRWYLAYTAPRRESLACEHLDRQGYETYLPLFGRLEAMFPRYLFFRPASATQSIAPVRSTRGVQAVVRFGMLYARVTDELVDAIRQQEAQLQTVRPCAGSALHPGQKIRVKDSAAAFAGLEGLVRFSAERRVVVLMELLGRQAPVSMPVENVEIV